MISQPHHPQSPPHFKSPAKQRYYYPIEDCASIIDRAGAGVWDGLRIPGFTPAVSFPRSFPPQRAEAVQASLWSENDIHRRYGAIFDEIAVRGWHWMRGGCVGCGVVTNWPFRKLRGKGLGCGRACRGGSTYKNRPVRTRMPWWCGSRELITSGYPIRFYLISIGRCEPPHSTTVNPVRAGLVNV